MINENIENNDDDKEIVSNEEVDNEVIVGNEELVEENSFEDTEENKKKAGFFPRLIAGFIDQTISIGLAVGLLFLFDAALRLAGYFVVDRTTIFFIIYVIVNVLYPSITESTKMDGTFGKWLLRIK